jgi:hypothetical protein
MAALHKEQKMADERHTWEATNLCTESNSTFNYYTIHSIYNAQHTPEYDFHADYFELSLGFGCDITVAATLGQLSDNLLEPAALLSVNTPALQGGSVLHDPHC